MLVDLFLCEILQIQHYMHYAWQVTIKQLLGLQIIFLITMKNKATMKLVVRSF
jgi:hypothetical protein